MTVNFGELRKGMAVELDGEPFIVVDYERSKMQQRAPVMRIRFRDLISGRMTERTFSGYDVDFKLAAVERRSAQYIYSDDDFYYFMDTVSFEQFPLSEEQIKDSLRYLIEQINVDLVLFRENPVAIEMPITVDLEVTETVPGFKGDTAQGGTKPATLETGLVVNVPMFVAQGEKIKVDTRTGNYLSRA
jgi:elongation factor P